MTGKELIESIENPQYKKREGRNRMGCCESFYDAYYLVYRAFKDNEELQTLKNLKNIDNLILVAGYAAEVFY